jgi:hypothetical protein
MENNPTSNNNNNNINNNKSRNNSNNGNGHDNDEKGGTNRCPPQGCIPDAPSDIAGAEISAANRKLDAVYGDHIHNNSGSHLRGGIGSAEDLTWQGYFRRLSVHNPSHYDIPRGSIGKAITNEFANLFEDIMERKCNFEKIIVFTQVLLQRENNVTASRDIKKRLKIRLDSWRLGKYKMLVETTEQALKPGQSKARDNTTTAQRARTFNSKIG